MSSNRNLTVVRRSLAWLLAVCMAAGYVPVSGFAEECAHIHGEDCFAATTECVHTHGDDCWSDPALRDAGEEPDTCAHVCTENTGCVTEALNCGHIHDEQCGDAVSQTQQEVQQPKEEQPKEEQPEEALKPQEVPQPKCVTAWQWVDDGEVLDPETGKLYLTATKEAPLYLEQIVEILPGAVEATVDAEPENLTVAHWDCPDYPQETGACSGSFLFAASLPDGYTLDEDVAALEVTVEFGGAAALEGVGEIGAAVFAEGRLTGYKTVEDAVAAGAEDTVLLMKDAVLSDTLTIKNNLTLDLNGKTLEGAAGKPVITVVGSVLLTLTDSSQEQSGKVTHNYSDTNKIGGGVELGESGQLLLSGGSVCSNFGTERIGVEGGGVRGGGSSVLIMTGGSIESNYAEYGGGCTVSRFLITGGAIQNNVGNDSYGGVRAEKAYLLGGRITGNGAGQNYGGVSAGSVILSKKCTAFDGKNYTGTEPLMITGNHVMKFVSMETGLLKSNLVLTGSNGAVIDGEIDPESSIGVTRTSGKPAVTGLTEALLPCFSVDAAPCKDYSSATKTLILYDTHDYNTESLCKRCGNLCTHSSATERGGVYTCDGCGRKIVAQLVHPHGSYVPPLYFVELADAFHSEYIGGGLILKLLSDAEIAQPVTVKPGENISYEYYFRMDLNGKKLTGAPITVSGKLTCQIEDNAGGGRVEADLNLAELDSSSLFFLAGGTYTRIIDHTGHLKKSGGDCGFPTAFRDTQGNWLIWDNVPDGDYTYQNVVSSYAPVAVIGVPRVKEMTYGGQIPTDYWWLWLTAADGCVRTVSWWEGQRKLEEKQLPDGDEHYREGTAVWSTLEAGTHAITCRIAAKKDGEPEYSVTYLLTLTVNKAEITDIQSPTPRTDLSYNGSGQSLITGGSAPNGTMVYSLTEEGPYTAAIPTGENARTYTVWYKVQGDKNHLDTTPQSLGVTIAPSGDYLDLTGTDLEQDGTVTIDGTPYPIRSEGNKYYVNLTGITGNYLTRYGYTGTGTARYPDSMAVYRLDRTNAGARLIRIPELDNLLLYEGCSIRLTGNKGIRMITSLDEQKKKVLTGEGLAGFTLEEYGTVVMRGAGNPTLADRSNYAYSKANRADPIFARADGRIQYTNVLVNFQPDDYNTELTLRPYITLKDSAGNEITLYGGCVTRTIHYIAQQNKDAGIYKPGSAGYRYLENILNGK